MARNMPVKRSHGASRDLVNKPGPKAVPGFLTLLSTTCHDHCVFAREMDHRVETLLISLAHTEEA